MGRQCSREGGVLRQSASQQSSKAMMARRCCGSPLTLGSRSSPAEKLLALVVVPLARAPANLPGVLLPPITPYGPLPFTPGLARPEWGWDPGMGTRSPAGCEVARVLYE